MRYARLAPGHGFRPLRACAHALDRLVVDPRVRFLIEEGLSRAVAAFHPPAAATADANRMPEIQRLRETGLLRLGRLLSAAQIADIRGRLREAPIFDVSDRSHGLNAPRTVKAPIVGYAVEVVLGCPHLLELAHEPRLLALIGAYLGCKPTIVTWGLLRSRPRTGADGITQRFHRDREGWRSLKLFVYLSEVDEGAGPHVYACGTHRTRSSLRARSYTDAEVAARVGTDAIETITGEAGFGFLADTFGLHKGESPVTRERLILQIHYATMPSPLYIYEPLRPSGAAPAVDPYINRLFVAGAEPTDRPAALWQGGRKEGVAAEP